MHFNCNLRSKFEVSALLYSLTAGMESASKSWPSNDISLRGARDLIRSLEASENLRSQAMPAPVTPVAETPAAATPVDATPVAPAAAPAAEAVPEAAVAVPEVASEAMEVTPSVKDVELQNRAWVK